MTNRNKQRLDGNRCLRFNTQKFIRKHEEHLTKKYELGEQIGAGAFGEVYSCRHRSTGKERAVKVVPKSFDQEENEKVLKEFEILKSLDHPNIIRLYELFADEDNFFIVTDIYKGGQLFDVIADDGPFEEAEAASLMVNILKCVNYCHQKNVIHRDLKPENILLDDNKKLEDLKVIDFGLSLRDSERLEDEFAGGSLVYMSPEALQGVSDSKGDIWACGVIAFVVLGGYAPFDGTEDEIMLQIDEAEVEFEYDVWDDISPRAKNFIKFLLNPDEDKRPTAEAALRHPWIALHRQESSKSFKRQSLLVAQDSLRSLQNFEAQGILKQATCAFIGSQLLSKEEKDDIDSLFRQIDVDCNGKLDYEEVRVGFEDFFGTQMSEGDLDAVFENVDLGRTGTIEYSEFVVACLLQKYLTEDKLKAAFEVFDADQDGAIDFHDLNKSLDFDNMDEKMIHRFIKEADLDGDGKVSFDEFRKMMDMSKKSSENNEPEDFGLDDSDDSVTNEDNVSVLHQGEEDYDDDDGELNTPAGTYFGKRTSSVSSSNSFGRSRSDLLVAEANMLSSSFRRSPKDVLRDEANLLRKVNRNNSWSHEQPFKKYANDDDDETGLLGNGGGGGGGRQRAWSHSDIVAGEEEDDNELLPTTMARSWSQSDLLGEEKIGKLNALPNPLERSQSYNDLLMDDHLDEPDYLFSGPKSSFNVQYDSLLEPPLSKMNVGALGNVRRRESLLEETSLQIPRYHHLLDY